MAATKETTEVKEPRQLFSDRNIEKFRVRDRLIVKLNEDKTYKSGELVEMTEEQYSRHAHQLETEEQYQARQKLALAKKTGDK